MPLANGQTARAEWRDNGTVVLAAMLATTLPIVHLYSTGVMLPALEAEFGWSRAQISSGPAIVSLVTVLLAPLIGIAIDRIGPRRIGLGGCALFCAALAGLASATGSLWHWWLLWAGLALAAAAVNPSVWTAGVTSLFVRSRGLALAVTLTGTGLGAILVPNLAARLLADHGWRAAYIGLGAIWAMAVLPVVYLFFWSAADRRRTAGERDAHRDHGSAAPGKTAKAAMMSSRFLKLALAAAAITIASNGIVINLVPILQAQAFSAPAAAGIAGLAGLGSIAGRLVGGFCLDRVPANLVGAGAAAILVCAMVPLFALPHVPLALSGAVLLLGLSVGVEYDAVAYLTARHFDLAIFGTLFGTITGLLALTGGLGPLIANLIYDHTGAYASALWLFVPLGIAAALLFLSIGADKAPAPDTGDLR